MFFLVQAIDEGTGAGRTKHQKGKVSIKHETKLEALIIFLRQMHVPLLVICYKISDI